MCGLYLQQPQCPIHLLARAWFGGFTHCHPARSSLQFGPFCVVSGVLRTRGGGGSSLPLGVHVLGGKLPRTRLFWMSAGVLAVILAFGTFAAFRYTAAAEPTAAPFSE